ncbi:MAG: heme exporter protein CcmD [Gammaproteobacteria bacterium]|nr:heme exporter protein CcmD [Gammaproteobacteria bacterium]
MKSWHEFISMGGYAAFVWPAYGIALVVLAVNALLPGRRQRQLLRELRQRAPRPGQTP